MLGLILLVSTLEGPAVSQTGSCPDADLSQRLEQLLETSDASGDGWRIEASVREGLDAQTVELTIEPPMGTTSVRTLSSPDCRIAIDAAAFIVATAIDPSIEVDMAPEASATLVPEPAPKAAEAPDLEPEPNSNPAQHPEPRPSRTPRPPSSLSRPQVWLGLGAGVMGGALPGPVGRVSLLAMVEGDWWRVRVDGAGSLRAEARASQVPEVGARMGHWAVGLRGCAVLRRGRLGVSGCGGGEAGQVYASGFGFVGATSTRLFWGAVLAAAGLEVDLTLRLRVWVDAEFGGVLDRPSVLVEGLERLHRLGPIFGRGALGLAVRL